MTKCDYKNCKEESTTYGYVYSREKEQILVHACDKHKKKPGFFEKVEKEMKR